MAREKDGKVGMGPGVVLVLAVAAGKSRPLSKPMTAMICPIWAAMDGMAREKEKKNGKVGIGAWWWWWWQGRAGPCPNQ